MPGGEAEVAGAELVGEVGEFFDGVVLHAADGDDDAEVVFSVGLFVGADVAVFGFGLRFGAEVL